MYCIGEIMPGGIYGVNFNYVINNNNSRYCQIWFLLMVATLRVVLYFSTSFYLFIEMWITFFGLFVWFSDLYFHRRLSWHFSASEKKKFRPDVKNLKLLSRKTSHVVFYAVPSRTAARVDQLPWNRLQPPNGH